jgi:hypothetical protein
MLNERSCHEKIYLKPPKHLQACLFFAQTNAKKTAKNATKK